MIGDTSRKIAACALLAAIAVVVACFFYGWVAG